MVQLRLAQREGQATDGARSGVVDAEREESSIAIRQVAARADK
jgi:hypothetical protein